MFFRGENMSEVPRHVMNVTSTPANCHVAPFAEHSSSIVTFPSGTPSPESLTCSPSLNCKRGQIILEIWARSELSVNPFDHKVREYANLDRIAAANERPLIALLDFARERLSSIEKKTLIRQLNKLIALVLDSQFEFYLAEEVTHSRNLRRLLEKGLHTFYKLQKISLKFNAIYGKWFWNIGRNTLPAVVDVVGSVEVVVDSVVVEVVGSVDVEVDSVVVDVVSSLLDP